MKVSFRLYWKMKEKLVYENYFHVYVFEKKSKQLFFSFFFL